MSGDTRPFKGRPGDFVEQLIASALAEEPTPDIRLVCARASLRTALEALRAEPPDLAAAKMFARDAIELINQSGV